MKRARPATCKVCGYKPRSAGRISARGLCAKCAESRHAESIRQIWARSGPYYDLWLTRTVAALKRPVD